MTPEQQATAAREILGECCCSEAWKIANSADPECGWCNFGDEVTAALAAAHAAGRAEMREECARIADRFGQGQFHNWLPGQIAEAIRSLPDASTDGRG